MSSPYGADESAKTKEDRSLSRSGLLMTGAADYIFGYETDFMAEDGVLTAREISQLDLSGLDLCVLSACQTALGDISGDGVFGLQRGFKKAGAKSILMSLWKVDDEATCLLMTEFYKNWITEGMTKHDALEAAKKAVRSHKEKGWDDPKYWAAFILLDADL
jgi:CHAT domain-containing protein